MPGPEMKTNESHASCTSVAYPFDAYSFPVSSPSEAELEPVAPPPQEAADGAGVCEAKSLLQQLIAGKSEAAITGIASRSDDDATPPLIGGILGGIFGRFRTAAAKFFSSSGSLAGSPSAASLPQDDRADALTFLPRSGAEDLKTLLPKVREIIREADHLSTELRASPKDFTDYRKAAWKIWGLYDDALELLKNNTAGNMSLFRSDSQGQEVARLVAASTLGKLRAGFFDLRSSDSLKLIDLEQSLERSPLSPEKKTEGFLQRLRGYRDWLDELLKLWEGGESQFMGEEFSSERFDIHSMLAAIEMKRGFYGSAERHSSAALKAAKQSKRRLPGVGDLLWLRLEALKKVGRGFSYGQELHELAGQFRQHQMNGGAIEATIEFIDVRMRIYESAKMDKSSGPSAPIQPIADELVALARLTGETPPQNWPSERPFLFESGPDTGPNEAISKGIAWLMDQGQESLVAETVERIADAFAESGDFRGAAMAFSAYGQIRNAQGARSDALPIHDKTMGFLNKAINVMDAKVAEETREAWMKALEEHLQASGRNPVIFLPKGIITDERTGCAMVESDAALAPQRKSVKDVLNDFPSFQNISPLRQAEIAEAVLKAVENSGLPSNIMIKGSLTPEGVWEILDAIGVTRAGVAKTLTPVRAEGRAEEGEGGKRRSGGFEEKGRKGK